MEEHTERIVKKNSWEDFTPWFLIVTSSIVLCLIAWFLAENLLWLRQHSVAEYDTKNLSYRSHTYFLYISSIRRSAGLFSGIALMFLGVGVSFYTIKSQTDINFSSPTLSVGIVTASPGIIAMVLGVFLVAHNTSSKDIVPIYDEVKSYREKPVLPSIDDIKKEGG